MHNITAKFPNAAETALLLKQKDAFLLRLSQADIAFRSASACASLEDLLELIANSGRDWRQEEESKVSACFEKACALLQNNVALLPPEIIFCKTNAAEEPGSAYCRSSHIIVLHEKALLRENDSLVRLLVHELFHIITRNHLDLRELLYREIGFYKTNEIEVDEKHKNKLITNPDACEIEYYFKARLARQNRNLYPLLIFTPENDSEKFKLQFYDATDGFLCGVEDIANYYEEIGQNTDYIIHPEEILAENFALMLCGGEIKTPQLIERLREVIRQYLLKREILVESGRLLFRRFKEEDRAVLERIFCDPQMMRYLGSAWDAAQLTSAVREWRGDWGRQNRWSGILLKKDSQEAIGFAGLTENTIPGEPGFELSWFVLPEHQRQGFAAEITGALLRVAFETWNAGRVIAETHPENPAANRLLGKIGFTCTGERHQIYDDLPGFDTQVLWEITRKSWNALSQKQKAIEILCAAPSKETLLQLISWLDMECSANPVTSLHQQILARAVIALGYALKEKLNYENIHRTIRAAEVYALEPSEDTFEAYRNAATDSYPFGPGEGCYAISETGYPACEAGSGCKSGAGCLYIPAELEDAAAMQSIAEALIPWLQDKEDPIAKQKRQTRE